MRVDVHTHVYPDRIAGVITQIMERDFGYDAVSPGTVDGIKSHMRASGVDKSIVLGVTERVDQVRGANDWLISIQDDMLVPFGAIHPDLEDKPGEVRLLRENGIKGIKLHPIMNQFYPDDPKMFPVYEEMGETMVLEIHSSKYCRRLHAPGIPDQLHQAKCSPIYSTFDHHQKGDRWIDRCPFQELDEN